jgi:hypothetical protein
MSYRHSSYRKMSRAVLKAAERPDESPSLTQAEMDRVLHWSNLAALPKPSGWGKPKGWRWPEGAACTDCAPDGVCEQACVDVPKNGKAKPVNAR